MLSMKEKESFRDLKIDCEKCFGLCCVALYFTSSDGFPEDKDAEVPCINLQSNYKCKVHKRLKSKKLRGCLSYDCFGSGQKISQITYKKRDWYQFPEEAKKMFESFLFMKQLHEMKWYLTQAYFLQNNKKVKADISQLLKRIDYQTFFDSDSLLSIDLESQRRSVNKHLRNTSAFIRGEILNKSDSVFKSENSKHLDYFGLDLRKHDLRGADLRGACLIAANLSGMDLGNADFIGADMRDANIKGADLRNSIFLAQYQINSSIGDSQTKLPSMIERPRHW